MSKRKPLPYHASYLIDQALMSLAVAQKQLKQLFEKSDLETVARTGKALTEINQATESLKEIKTAR